MKVKSFDHVALWAHERDELAEVLTTCCDMHVIERTEEFTLVGGDALQGKLTLFAADGARDPGALRRIVLRVPSLAAARERIDAAGLGPVSGNPEWELHVDGPAGAPLGFVAGPDGRPGDLDHVVLAVPDPGTTAKTFRALGLRADGHRLVVGDRHLVLQASAGTPPGGGGPLLNHLAFLVDDLPAVRGEAVEHGFEIEREVDAPNTWAVFLTGPDAITIELVQHKPTFALV